MNDTFYRDLYNIQKIRQTNPNISDKKISDIISRTGPSIINSFYKSIPYSVLGMPIFLSTFAHNGFYANTRIRRPNRLAAGVLGFALPALSIHGIDTIKYRDSLTVLDTILNRDKYLN